MLLALFGSTGGKLKENSESWPKNSLRETVSPTGSSLGLSGAWERGGGSNSTGFPPVEAALEAVWDAGKGVSRKSLVGRRLCSLYVEVRGRLGAGNDSGEGGGISMETWVKAGR